MLADGIVTSRRREKERRKSVSFVSVTDTTCSVTLIAVDAIKNSLVAATTRGETLKASHSA